MAEEAAEITLFAAAMDVIQAVAAMETIAVVIAAFQKALVQEGFSGADALTLCNTWLAASVGQARSKDT